MRNNNLSTKIKELRKSKGFSQEDLAFKTGLSLRTIQRIENNETEPRGDSLKKISNVLGLSSNDVYELGFIEDSTVLKTINLSSLGFLIFPIMGIILPLIFWISNKNRIKHADKIGKSVLNFQITWCLIYFSALTIFALSLFFTAIHDWLSLKELTTFYWVSPALIMLIMYSINLRTIFLNNKRIRKNVSVVYKPSIRFIK